MPAEKVLPERGDAQQGTAPPGAPTPREASRSLASPSAALRANPKVPEQKYFALVGGPGSIKDSDAAIIGPELERIFEKGVRSSAAIVNEARKPTSPLHRYFEWNDSVAAEAWRRAQAALIVRSIVIRVPTATTDETVRAFHLVRRNPEVSTHKEYVAIAEALASEEMRSQIVERAFRELASWRRTYSSYQSVFGGVFAAIDDLALAEADE